MGPTHTLKAADVLSLPDYIDVDCARTTNEDIRIYYHCCTVHIFRKLLRLYPPRVSWGREEYILLTFD